MWLLPNVMTNVNVCIITKGHFPILLIPSTNYKTEKFTDTDTNPYKHMVAVIIHLLHVSR